MSNTDIQKYVYDTFGVRWSDHPAMDALANTNLNTRNPQDFCKTLVDKYVDIAKAYPEIHEQMRPVFMGIVRYGLAQPSTQHWWPCELAEVMPLLTRNNTNDLSKQEASEMARYLRSMMKQGGSADVFVASMLYNSTALWEYVGEDLLGLRKPFHAEQVIDANKLYLLHRYAPDVRPLHGIELNNAHAQMAGWLSKFKSPLLGMHNVLIPEHNHARAWSAALAYCEDPPLGQWAAMASVFEALPLDPSDPQAWSVVVQLHEKAQQDPSCAQMLNALQHKHQAIFNAYENAWPVICSLYDTPVLQFEAAAKFVTTANNPTFELPEDIHEMR